MVSLCLPVAIEQIRAEVLLGDQLLASTPWVKSFNIQASRNQLTNTCNVTLELEGGRPFPGGLNQRLTIRSGLRGQLKQRFSGNITGISPSPSFGKPSYYLINITCEGVLSELENKTFSRRLKSDGQGLFCMITGGVENRPTAYYSLDKMVKAGNHTVISSSPGFSGVGENSPLVVNRNSGSGSAVGAGPAGTLASVAGRPIGGGGSGEGFRQHTHESLDEGGPAFGTFSD